MRITEGGQAGKRSSEDLSRSVEVLSFSFRYSGLNEAAGGTLRVGNLKRFQTALTSRYYRQGMNRFGNVFVRNALDTNRASLLVAAA
jgi:hypothetical protein